MSIGVAMVMETMMPIAHGSWQFIVTGGWVMKQILLHGCFGEDATVVENGATTTNTFNANTQCTFACECVPFHFGVGLSGC